jgi:hypothetical protein
MDTLKKILLIIAAIITFYLVVTNTIYAFSHPEKTKTQLFLHIPKTFILNFKD